MYYPMILKGRPVNSQEEALSSSVDYDGSISIYPDFNNKKIYTKQMALNGTVVFNVYELKENNNNASPYITKEEFEEFKQSLNKTKEKKEGF